jgi:hypothetical protein
MVVMMIMSRFQTRLTIARRKGRQRKRGERRRERIVLYSRPTPALIEDDRTAITATAQMITAVIRLGLIAAMDWGLGGIAMITKM